MDSDCSCSNSESLSKTKTLRKPGTVSSHSYSGTCCVGHGSYPRTNLSSEINNFFFVSKWARCIENQNHFNSKKGGLWLPPQDSHAHKQLDRRRGKIAVFTHHLLTLNLAFAWGWQLSTWRGCLGPTSSQATIEAGRVDHIFCSKRINTRLSRGVCGRSMGACRKLTPCSLSKDVGALAPVMYQWQ